MRRGLRQSENAVNFSLVFNSEKVGPDEKGIETSLASFPPKENPVSEKVGPDEKGIETWFHNRRCRSTRER